ncbi:MAG: tannase/feruloyl esterase family alpha/beta hydrolase [Caulobacteraceae bacterium]
MVRAILLSAAATLAMTAASAHAQTADDASCQALARLALPDVHVASAAIVPAQDGWSPEPGGRPIAVKAPFCRVQGVVETEIGFELWLPARAAWNGKFLGTGVGGDAGAFNFRDLPRGVARGYASGTTDSGHKQADRTWMLGDPMRLKNYELRAHHLLAVKSKDLILAYYGASARHAYFIGCSGGGRQGLKEIQRFPADYDGVVAGAGGPKTPEMTVRRMWELLLRDGRPGLMSPADWKLIADAGVKDCDGLDGVVDGVAENPRRCRFDLASLRCKPGATAGCLNEDQIAFARQFYAPLKDGAGRALDTGLLPGVLVDSGRSRLAPATFAQAIRHVADWDGKDFDASRDLAAIDRVMPELRADDADLSAYKARGGKAIFYEGWMDPAVSANMIVDYQKAVEARMGGEEAAAQFERLFMVPGMLHCGGGAGPDQFGGSGGDAPIPDPQHDLLSALEDWVEHGRAPGRIVASKLEGGRVVRTRPLCAWPAEARYTGKGSTDDAASFVCDRRP